MALIKRIKLHRRDGNHLNIAEKNVIFVARNPHLITPNKLCIAGFTQGNGLAARQNVIFKTGVEGDVFHEISCWNCQIKILKVLTGTRFPLKSLGRLIRLFGSLYEPKRESKRLMIYISLFSLRSLPLRNVP